jgi:hypothetical protein
LPRIAYRNNAILDAEAAWATNFTIEYVELPNGRTPAREFVDLLDDRAAARIDAFIDRLRVHGNRMQGKFVKKLRHEIFELRSKNSIASSGFFSSISPEW